MKFRIHDLFQVLHEYSFDWTQTHTHTHTHCAILLSVIILIPLSILCDIHDKYAAMHKDDIVKWLNIINNKPGQYVYSTEGAWAEPSYMVVGTETLLIEESS